MCSLSLPRLSSTSSFTSHRLHFLQRKPLSVSIPSTTPKSHLLIASFRPFHLSTRFQLAAIEDSLPPGADFEGEEEGEQMISEDVQAKEEEGQTDEYGFLEDKEEEADGEEEEYYEEEEESMGARMVLKFIWMEKNIGVALEKVIPGGKGSIPLTPYYFWPRKDAWEELKAKLEEKRWVSQKRMIILLNQATDIINLWQQSGAPTPMV